MKPGVGAVGAVVAVAAMGLGACGGGTADDAGPSPGAGGATRTTLTVSAASSLTEAFGALAERFEADHPDVDVRLNFDGSSALADQILEGAPVDVFASADATNAAEVADAGLTVEAPVTFARNRLAIVVPAGNPDDIDDLADLATLAGTVALCAADAPCGTLAAGVLESSAVALDKGQVSRGQNAKATLAAVTDGDAAAALVYVTDARTAGDAVETVPITTTSPATTELQILRLAARPSSELAEQFVELVVGADGQAELARRGFLPPG